MQRLKMKFVNFVRTKNIQVIDAK